MRKAIAGPDARIERVSLVVIFFAFYLLIYLILVSVAIDNHPGLKVVSNQFIPPSGNLIPGFSYLGFILPLGVALVAIVLLLLNSNIPRRKILGRHLLRQKWWLLLASGCVIVWN
ncbi:MAG: hypothetical protein ACREBS_09220, partial [Nitrososphaerales archaeon]